MAKSEEFFQERWPEARAIADPRRVLYKAFGIGAGKPLQLIGPGIFTSSARAMVKGHMQGETVGDPLVMPGLFAVQGDRILWEHKFKHAGDHPDWVRLPALAGFDRIPVA